MSHRNQHTGMTSIAKFAVAACVAALTLAGCGSDDTDTPSATATTEPSAGTTSSGTTSSSPGPTASDGAKTNGAADLIAAGKTAMKQVKGSTLISIESENGGSRWEVQVVTDDGTEHEMDISADGSQVISGPREEHEDSADKAKHRDRVKAAKIDFQAAAKRLLKEIPGGEITELNLDTERGRTIWEADVIDSSNKKHEVDLDAASGEILSNEVSG